MSDVPWNDRNDALSCGRTEFSISTVIALLASSILSQLFFFAIRGRIGELGNLGLRKQVLFQRVNFFCDGTTHLCIFFGNACFQCLNLAVVSCDLLI